MTPPIYISLSINVFYRAFPLEEELQQIDDGGRRRISFLQGQDPWRSGQSQEVSPNISEQEY